MARAWLTATIMARPIRIHHGHRHADYHHGDLATAGVADDDATASVRSSDCVSDCDECDICAFLSQIKCESPQIVVAEIWQHVISAIPAALQRSLLADIARPSLATRPAVSFGVTFDRVRRAFRRALRVPSGAFQ